MSPTQEKNVTTCGRGEVELDHQCTIIIITGGHHCLPRPPSSRPVRGQSAARWSPLSRRPGQRPWSRERLGLVDRGVRVVLHHSWTLVCQSPSANLDSRLAGVASTNQGIPRTPHPIPSPPSFPVRRCTTASASSPITSREKSLVCAKVEPSWLWTPVSDGYCGDQMSDSWTTLCIINTT